jgi:hypothetical protein
MPDRSVTATLQLHEHGINHRRLTHFSRSSRDLDSASPYQCLNRTDERSPTPTISRVDWTSIRFDRRKRAGAKKRLSKTTCRTLLLGWTINNAAPISWPVAELMTVEVVIRCCVDAICYELLWKEQVQCTDRVSQTSRSTRQPAAQVKSGRTHVNTGKM